MSLGDNAAGDPVVVMRVKCLDDEPTLSALPEGHNCNADFKLMMGTGGSQLLDGSYAFRVCLRDSSIPSAIHVM